MIDVRHSCCSSSRIAEISVPAWPIPIHQTKLTIAKPQPTGTLTPQMPIPRTSRYPIAAKSHIVSEKATRNPIHQNRGVRRVRTIEEILSVTDANVWPGLENLGGARVVDRREGVAHFCPVSESSSVWGKSVRTASASAGFGFRTAPR